MNSLKLSLSLSLSLSFSINPFSPFTQTSFFTTTTAAAAPLCKVEAQEAQEAQGPTEAAATPIPSFVVLGALQNKVFLPHFIPFHFHSFLLITHCSWTRDQLSWVVHAHS
jgi:hypothetical protein